MNNACLLELKKAYNAGQLLPFIGAGASMSVEWEVEGKRKRGPSWSEVVAYAISLLGYEDPQLLRIRGNDLQILEYFKIQNNGERAKLINWLYSEMRPSDTELRNSVLHSSLCKLQKCRTYYTTNFDDFIERSFAQHGRECVPIASEHDIIKASSNKNACQVIKFHGDFNNPNSMVVTESHYEQRLAMNTALDYRLRSDLLGRIVLFIGYSFRDPNVSYLFRIFNENFRNFPGSSTGRRAFIISPDPSVFEIKLFRARNIEVIPVNSLNMTDNISKLLNEITSY